MNALQERMVNQLPDPWEYETEYMEPVVRVQRPVEGSRHPERGLIYANGSTEFSNSPRDGWERTQAEIAWNWVFWSASVRSALRRLVRPSRGDRNIVHRWAAAWVEPRKVAPELSGRIASVTRVLHLLVDTALVWWLIQLI